MRGACRPKMLRTRAYNPLVEGLVSLDSVVVAAERQLSTTFGDEVVILGLRDSAYYGLENVGSRVWSLLQSPRSLREIVDTLVSEYAVTSEDAARDLQALVSDLHAHGLVDIRPATGA